jgi:uncharacterized protein (DUF2249 family)
MSALPPRPPTVKGFDAACRVDLDVREEVRSGQEPFSRIMAAVSALAPGQVLVIRAPFEPVPLYRALGQRGFAHWTEQRAADDWSVWFYPRRLTIDVRELEPPEPMLRVFDALETLAPGQHLEVRHNRRPIFLYPQLEERGFTHETDEPEEGIVRIVIRRREETPE